MSSRAMQQMETNCDHDRPSMERILDHADVVDSVSRVDERRHHRLSRRFAREDGAIAGRRHVASLVRGRQRSREEYFDVFNHDETEEMDLVAFPSPPAATNETTITQEADLQREERRRHVRWRDRIGENDDISRRYIYQDAAAIRWRLYLTGDLIRARVNKGINASRTHLNKDPESTEGASVGREEAAEVARSPLRDRAMAAIARARGRLVDGHSIQRADERGVEGIQPGPQQLQREPRRA